MDWNSLVEFKKYTVALAAAGFAYTLENFVPIPTADGRWFVVVILGAFLLSSLFGILTQPRSGNPLATSFSAFMCTADLSGGLSSDRSLCQHWSR
jgi:hypothetical protein